MTANPHKFDIISPPFQVMFVKVTPDMAKRCLEKNKIQNRNLSPSRVDAIVADLTMGNWKTTHQGAAFDSNYNLIDGGHRFAAIRDSGVSAIMMVSSGVPLDTLSTIDNTRPRSVSDHVTQMVSTNPDYVGITTAYAAVASVIEYGYSTFPHLSMNQKLMLVYKYKDAIEFAIRHGKGCTGLQATSKAIIARAYYTQDKDKLKRFCEVYRTELPDGKHEWGASALKKFLTGSNLAGWSARKEVYQKTESALSNFIRGIPMSKVYGTEKELFPLPSTF